MGLKLLFVGVNPGLGSAAVGAPFANRSNRFWRALLGAGLVDHLIDTSGGWTDADREHLRRRGIEITALVARATAAAAELDDRELIEGVAGLEEEVTRLEPTVVAFLGVTAFRTAFDRPRAVLGRQPDPIAGRPLWIVPNPSGRNAHASLETLIATYREVGEAAGIEPYGS
jgi:double-stranded uracil-DNA glycosylase